MTDDDRPARRADAYGRRPTDAPASRQANARHSITRTSAPPLPFLSRDLETAECTSSSLRLELLLSGLPASPRLSKAINGEACGAKIEAS